MDVSLSYFLSEMTASPIMLITVVLTLGVIFVNGWTDAPNAIATCISTRCMNVRSAILMSAAFNFLGVLIMTHINSSVVSTISNMVDFGGNTQYNDGFRYEGYYAGIDSLQKYYQHSMELLQKDVRDALFGARDIYTKVRDSAPSKYMDGAKVSNSLISDGCVIEGTVENCILFRGVKVGKGSVVKNSIVMQDTVIGSGAQLDCVITDKNVVVRDRRHLAGCAELPYFIAKGRML